MNRQPKRHPPHGIFVSIPFDLHFSNAPMTEPHATPRFYSAQSKVPPDSVVFDLH